MTEISAFCRAAEEGNVDELVRIFSTSEHPSVLLDTPDKYGWTALNAAAYYGHVSVIETLVGLGSKAIDTPDNFGYTPMYQAAANGHVSVIELLVRLGSNAIDTPDKFDFTPVSSAAWNGHVSAIEALVRLGSNAIDTPNKNCKTLLSLAVEKGEPEVIDTLLALGCTNDRKASSTFTQEQVADVRLRVYFSFSLAHRLLLELSRQTEAPKHAKCVLS